MPKSGTESKPLFFKSPDEYRRWLEKNHDSATELWIGFWKKATGKPSLTWEQVVDESLCFGWIDGIRKSIDTNSFKQRVTPRRKTSVWSQINIRKIGELTTGGRMHPAGHAAFEKRDHTKVYSYENFKRGLSPADEAQFKKNKKAWEFFQAQPAGYRRVMTHRVMSAKREETREKRLEQLISVSARGRRVNLLKPEW